MSPEAGVYSVYTIDEMHSMVRNLTMEGFRIITVITAENGLYHVVAQQEPRRKRDMKGDAIIGITLALAAIGAVAGATVVSLALLAHAAKVSL